MFEIFNSFRPGINIILKNTVFKCYYIMGFLVTKQEEVAHYKGNNLFIIIIISNYYYNK